MMTARSSRVWQENGIAEASAEFGRLAADMMRNAPILPVHPLMAHPMAAMAAVTAIGFGLTSQMAGAVFGALQGAVDAANRHRAHEDGDRVADVPVAQPVVNELAAVDAKAPAPKAPAVVKGKAAPRKAAARRVTKATPDKTSAEAETPPVAAKPAATRGRKAAADDLKRISGIGPKLEQVLNERGIRRFADIASWTDTDVARIEGEFGIEGRIGRDDWVEQAKALVKASGRK
jgi:NADH-quinone oxidoreductase subunit E